MEYFNLRDYNQHQLIRTSPTLMIGPSLVFLTPTKKGLRSPILKCKILLGSNHMDLLYNQPLFCTSISPHHSAGKHCSSIYGQYAHHCCLTLLLITSAHYCCSSLLLKYLYTSTLLIIVGHYFSAH